MTPLDHMTYDQARGKYIQQQPPKDASISMTIQVDSDEYLCLVPKFLLTIAKSHCMWNGTKWPHNQSKPLPMILMSADTGAQVDTIGPQHLAKLGLDEEGLLRSSVGLFCADDSKATYLGVFLAKITGTSKETGQSNTVHSMIYMIRGANCLMSRSTLQGLGCLPKSFPEVGKYDEGILQGKSDVPRTTPSSDLPCKTPSSNFPTSGNEFGRHPSPWREDLLIKQFAPRIT